MFHRMGLACIVFTVAACGGAHQPATTKPVPEPTGEPHLARLDRDLATMRGLPWRSWSVDQQIDFRWVYANAETAHHQLVDERTFVHRPAAWLESLSNQLIAFASYVPEDRARPAAIWGL